jgi:hypothetical protein
MSKKKHMSKSKLLGDSPHLSDEVLREMADRTDVLPDDIIMEIQVRKPLIPASLAKEPISINSLLTKR